MWMEAYCGWVGLTHSATWVETLCECVGSVCSVTAGSDRGHFKEAPSLVSTGATQIICLCASHLALLLWEWNHGNSEGADKVVGGYRIECFSGA